MIQDKNVVNIYIFVRVSLGPILSKFCDTCMLWIYFHLTPKASISKATFQVLAKDFEYTL
jgi:hypothetical protein